MSNKDEQKQIPQLTPELFEAFQMFLTQMEYQPVVKEEDKKQSNKKTKKQTQKPEKITKKYFLVDTKK